MLHYRRNPEWDRKKLEELKQLTGLKVSQIYKWMWDTRKREEKEAAIAQAEAAKNNANKRTSKAATKSQATEVKRRTVWLTHGGTGDSKEVEKP
jgi:hypothetical protein